MKLIYIKFWFGNISYLIINLNIYDSKTVNNIF